MNLTSYTLTAGTSEESTARGNKEEQIWVYMIRYQFFLITSMLFYFFILLLLFQWKYQDGI